MVHAVSLETTILAQKDVECKNGPQTLPHDRHPVAAFSENFAAVHGVIICFKGCLVETAVPSATEFDSLARGVVVNQRKLWLCSDCNATFCLVTPCINRHAGNCQPRGRAS
jgi:hypothetical protein